MVEREPGSQWYWHVGQCQGRGPHVEVLGADCLEAGHRWGSAGCGKDWSAAAEAKFTCLEIVP